MIDLSGNASSGRRVLLYGSDTHGSGHLRQSLQLAGRLVRLPEVASALVIGACPSPVALERPDGVDLITLPAAVESGATYRSQTLGVSLADLVRVRGDVLTQVVESYQPDLMVVDDDPVGFEAELWPLFQRLVEARSRPRLVLGLRDVVEAADRVDDEWSRLDAWRVVDRLYDRVLVYGDDTVVTTATELRLARRLGGRVRHVGYLSRSLPKPGAEDHTKPLVLITDDDRACGLMLDAYADFLSSSGAASIELRVGDDTAEAISNAAAVVAIADYPTVCDVLAARVPALFVPRLGPSQEQSLRAERVAGACGFVVMSPYDLSARRLQQFAADQGRRVVDHPLTVNGFDTVTGEVAALLAQPASFGPLRAIEPSAELRAASDVDHAASADATLRVGYVVPTFPRPAQRVIMQEMLGLEQAGVALHVLSLGRPDEEEDRPELSERLAAPVSTIEETSSSLRMLFESLDRRAGRDGARQARGLLHRLPGPTGVRVLNHALQVGDHVEAAGIGHLHAHGLDEGAHTAFVVHVMTGIPFSVTVHGADVFRHNVDREAFAAVAAAATAVITTSDAARHHVVHELLPDRDARVEVVANAADIGAESPDDDLASDRIGGFVLAAGTLEERKGFDVLVDACARLLDSGVDVGCAIVGDGPDRTHLATRIRALGISERIRLAGDLPHSQVVDLMRKAMAVAVPSVVSIDGSRDSLPPILLEAMSRGTPVVTTAVAGIPELVDDGLDGIVVPPRDPDALAAGLQLLLQERATWSRMSTGAVMKIRHRFAPLTATRDLATILGHTTPLLAG